VSQKKKKKTTLLIHVLLVALRVLGQFRPQGVKTVFDEALRTVIKSRGGSLGFGGSGGRKCCTLF
jgi:hypothetical protein